MVTALVLLNRLCALGVWTGLRIGNHPSYVLALIAIFDLPF